MSITDLESEVEKLSPTDLERFSEWFEEFIGSRWDRSIEEDIKAGRLDR